MGKLRITYTKSMIGYSKDQKATIRSLGLHKLQSSVVHDDTPSIRGMAFKVRHLVTLEELAEGQSAPAPKTVGPKIVKPEVAPTQPKAAPAAAPAKPAATFAVAPAEETPAAAEDSAADDLTLIEGIGPKIASVLQQHGIMTFAQLAATEVSRLNGILQEANLRLAHADTWPEQAALAAAGDWDGFKALTDELKGGRRV